MSWCLVLTFSLINASISILDRLALGDCIDEPAEPREDERPTRLDLSLLLFLADGLDDIGAPCDSGKSTGIATADAILEFGLIYPFLARIII